MKITVAFMMLACVFFLWSCSDDFQTRKKNTIGHFNSCIITGDGKTAEFKRVDISQYGHNKAGLAILEKTKVSEDLKRPVISFIYIDRFNNMDVLRIYWLATSSNAADSVLVRKKGENDRVMAFGKADIEENERDSKHYLDYCNHMKFSIDVPGNDVSDIYVALFGNGEIVSEFHGIDEIKERRLVSTDALSH